MPPYRMNRGINVQIQQEHMKAVCLYLMLSCLFNSKDGYGFEKQSRIIILIKAIYWLLLLFRPLFGVSIQKW